MKQRSSKKLRSSGTSAARLALIGTLGAAVIGLTGTMAGKFIDSKSRPDRTSIPAAVIVQVNQQDDKEEDRAPTQRFSADTIMASHARGSQLAHTISDEKHRTLRDQNSGQFVQVLKDARKLLENEQYGEAFRRFRNALSIVPNHLINEIQQEAVAKAELSYSREDFSEAAKQFADAFRDFPLQ